MMDSKRGLARTGLLGLLLASALSGCCIMTPLASVCAPGGFGGGHRERGHHHFHGAAQPATDGAAAVAAVEADALAGMYAYAAGGTDAGPAP